MQNKEITILLIDDDEVDVMSVQRAFSKNKIMNPLHVAYNGLEALAKLRGEGVEKITPLPKIILLDINMPRMNGIEFLHALRDDPELKSICVFMLTTSNEERDKISAYDLNVAGYILKPVELEKLFEAVKTINLYCPLIELP